MTDHRRWPNPSPLSRQERASWSHNELSQVAQLRGEQPIRNYRAQLRFVTLLTIVVLAMGCAKYQTVSPSRFGDAKQGWGEKYRITMNDGAHYITTSFTVEDSTLLVQEVTKTGSEVVSVPFSVPVSDIKRIELVTVDTKRSVIVAAVVAAVIAGALYWLWQSLPY